MRVKKSTAQKKAIRVAPELPGGFRDYPPEMTVAKQRILDTARRTFELFGFEPMETPAVERTEVLTGGEADSQKIIFNVVGSQDKGESDTSLRFDLTVPLARFIAANPAIPKPFKRYQMGNVWRGERPQKGRYREFTQADIDIVGSSSPAADAEVIAAIYTTLKNLEVGEFVIKINDRAVLNDLPRLAGFPEEKLWDALRIIDKRGKIGTADVVQELTAEFNATAAEKIEKFLAEPLALPDIEKKLTAIKIPREYYRFDKTLVRGLSYYTGTIFEATLTDLPEIGSVFGGGRYDNLVMNFTGQKIPAVGASLGVDRLLAALEQQRKFDASKTLQVLVLNLSENLENECLAITQQLRDLGVNATLYLGDDRDFRAQLAYAVKKEIPYVVIYGEDENKRGVVAIKNLKARTQENVARRNIKEYFMRP